MPAKIDAVCRPTRSGWILPLLEDLDQTLAAVELLLRGLVEVRAELRERRELAVLREVETERARHRAHRAHLRRAADARHRDADVDGRTDARVEEVRLQEDLAVGDGDDVRRDVRRNVAGLGLDDRQRRERTAATRVTELRGALQETRVEIEDVARIRLAARRAAEQQRDLAIRRGVLGEIVVDDQRVLAVVEEVLADRAAGIRREVLQRRRFRRRGVDDHRVVHRPVLLEGLDHLRDGRLLLTDRHVDALHVLALLVDDRVDRHGRLAGLAVADDQLALAAADRNHRVDGLEPRLQRLFDGLPVDDARGQALDRVVLGGSDRALAVDRQAQGVHDPAQNRGADRHRHDPSGALALIAFLQLLVVAEEHDADVVFLEVEGQTGDVVRKLDQLTGHDPLQAVHAGNAVADGGDGADFRHLDTAADAG